MAGRQDGIPIAEASARLGLSAEAVRKRLQRGTLHGYKDDDGGWFVLPGDLYGTAERQDTVRTDRQDDGRTPRPDGRTPPEEPIEAPYRVTPAAIEQAVSRTGVQYVGDLRTMLAEVGKVYEGQLAAKDETIASLRAQLEMAERDRVYLHTEATRAREQLTHMQHEETRRIVTAAEEREASRVAAESALSARSWWARLFGRE